MFDTIVGRRQRKGIVSVVVIGIEHQDAPLDVLERMALGEPEQLKLLATLRQRANLSESVVLSTCLRTEVYAVVDRFHDAVDEIHEVLADKAGSTSASWRSTPASASTTRSPSTSSRWRRASSRPCSARAKCSARSAGHGSAPRTSGWPEPVLCELFRHALADREAGPFGDGHRPGHDVVLARRGGAGRSPAPRGLAGSSVLVVGAGEMGAGRAGRAVSLPAARRPGEVVVANRTQAWAAGLARAGPRGDLRAHREHGRPAGRPGRR